MNIIAVFKSRNETMRFANALKINGVGVTVINTPKSANVGCGISAKFSAFSLNFAKRILNNGYYSSFVGFFNFFDNGNKGIVS